MANRDRPEIEPLIGLFVNMLPMRTNIDGNLRFTELLKRVKDVTLGAYLHQEMPFENLVEEIQMEQELGRMPLFNIAFGVRNAPEEETRPTGLKISSIVAGPETARFDLTLWITKDAGAIQAAWTYSADLFEEETIVRMHGHFETLLSNIVARPDAQVDELEMLSDNELAQQAVDRAVSKKHNYSRFKRVKPKAVILSKD